MRLKSTQRKSLATVPTNYQGQERRFAQSVSESLDVLTGRRGDIIDRAVTFRDLIDTGVLKLAKGLGTGGGSTVLNPNENPTGGPTQLPTQPENFTATGGFGIIFLDWDLPPYNGHDYVEIYRLQRASGAAEPTLVQAQEAGVYTRYYGDIYKFTDTNVGSQEQWYYWIRAVNIDGVAGPFYSTDGVDATTALDYVYVSGLIDDILDDASASLGLNAALGDLSDDILSLENFTGFTSGYNGDSLITRIGDVETVAGNAATSAQLQSEQTARANADSALAADITTLNATVYDQTTGVAATYSGLQSEITARANADSALSSSITSLTTTVNGNTASIQTNATSINGVEAKYSVKIDNNGHVSGFGLISTDNDHATGTSGALPTSTTSSAFIIAADRFAVAAPYNANSTNNSNVGTNYPFKVLTTDTYLYRDGAYVKDADGNFVLIPAGVYIDDAFIHEAQITSASIGEAIITDGHIENLTATKITSGNIQIDAANDIKIYQGKTSFTSTASGFWLGLNNNAGSFHVGYDANKYLKFDGNTGDLETSGLEIKASDGTVLVDAGGLRTGSGGQLAYNGDFHKNEDGWTAFIGTGGSGSAYISGGVAYCGYQQYFKQATQRFPVTRGEKLYVYGWSNVQGTSSTGMRLGATFYNSSDPTASSVSTGTVYVGGNGSGATQLSIEYDSTIGQYFAIGVITVPNSGNSKYAEFRFGNLNYSGTISYIGVGISRTPPAIGPNYASTYIRNLSVDTLQIAGNAVTVPLGASNENISSTYYLAISGTQTSEGTSWAKVCDLSAMSWTSSDTAPEAITLVGSMNYGAATSGSSFETVRLKLIMRAGATVPATYISSGVSATSNVTQLQSCGVSKQRNHSGTLAVNYTLDVSQLNLQPNTNYYFALVGQTNAGSRRMFNNGLSAVASKK